MASFKTKTNKFGIFIKDLSKGVQFSCFYFLDIFKIQFLC